ncbi:MAG: RHS repeat-associated core domain-containing protein [Chloroflexota bacterium]
MRDGENVLIETDGALATVAQHTDLPGMWGGKYAQRRSGASRFYVSDFQGNTRVLLDAAAAVADTLTTDAWGVELARTGATVDPFMAHGQWGYWRDTASRLYVRARHLRVDQGRWVSRDPIGSDAGGPNLYGYVRGAPTRAIDPGGLYCMPAPDLCGAAIDRWLLAEVVAQRDVVRRAAKEYESKWGLELYAWWAYTNMPYKWWQWYQFNKHLKFWAPGPAVPPVPDYNCPRPWRGDGGCGGTVWMCDHCVRTSTLGNVMYGYIGAYQGMTLKGLTEEVKSIKGTVHAHVDRYDERAYKLGWEMHRARPSAGDFCKAFRAVVASMPDALYEGKEGGGHVEYSHCGKCGWADYPGTRHLGGEWWQLRLPRASEYLFWAKGVPSGGWLAGSDPDLWP